jgi:predicted O-linked N-acetylglucosamine transferase (SPINDLY family)
MNPQLIYLIQTAIQDIQANKLESAKLLLLRALKIDSKHPDVLRFLGVIAALEQDWQEALRLIDAALETNPKNGIAHSNRANILKELMRYEEALDGYKKAISIDPQYAEAYNNMGNTLQSLERYEEALDCYKKAISIDPQYAEAYSNMGNTLQSLERYEEALQCYEKSLLINQNNSHALYGAARIFNLRKQYGHSIACIERAIHINPQNIDAWMELARTQFQVKDYDNAISALDKVLAINSNYFDAWLGKGDIFYEKKQFDLAQGAFAKAYEINSSADFLFGLYLQALLQTCSWGSFNRDVEKLARDIVEGKRSALPYNAITLLDDPYLIKNAIEIYAKSIQGDIKREVLPAVEGNSRIRVAYFSADFHNHPTAYLMAELFECHDKNQFEIIGFVFGRNQPDEMRGRLIKAFDQFIDVDHLTDKEIAELAREMKIDIAVDLKGFTQEGRPKIFMYGAAPIQVSYLAFPGTMGLPCFDYLIADPVLIPVETQSAYAEKIIYMPNSYQVNDRHRLISPNLPSRASLGLPEDAFVFCCFNNNYKITPDVFEGWIRILNAVENSVLWLFADNSIAIDSLKKHASSQGLNAERLIFAPPLPTAKHLARYQLADLFLDTSPCNAHTTASDALWAGLPIVTLLGKSFGARVAASLLNAVGLSELVSHSQKEYETIAVELASNPSKLQEFRERLLENRFSAPLFDTPLFARHLESAYQAIFDRHQLKLPTDHIYVVP